MSPGEFMPNAQVGRIGALWRAVRLAGEVLVESLKDSLTDNLGEWAAAVAFYALLSVFPMLLAVVSFAAYFVDANWALREATRAVGQMFPQGRALVVHVIHEAIEARGTASVLSLLGLVLAGSRVFGVLTVALNVAYDVEESYGFWKRALHQIVTTLTVGVLFLVALLGGALLDALGHLVKRVPIVGDPAVRLAAWSTTALLTVTVCALIYQFVPRGRRAWRASMAGGTVAGALLLVARPLFVEYAARIARYNLVYGSLAVVVFLLVWAWVAATIVLFGGEVASHVEMMVLEHRSATEVEGRHVARSPVRRPEHKKRPAPPRT